MIKCKNRVKEKYEGLSRRLISSAVALAIMLPSVPASYANPEDEERNSSIRVYHNSNKAGTLVTPQHLNVEYLDVNLSQKKLTIFHVGKEPQELNPAFHPTAFPWQLSPEDMQIFLDSQSFLLKQFDDGTYKLNMHTIGKGGVLPYVIGAAIAIGATFAFPSKVYAPGPDPKPAPKKPAPKKK